MTTFVRFAFTPVMLGLEAWLIIVVVVLNNNRTIHSVRISQLMKRMNSRKVRLGCI